MCRAIEEVRREAAEKSFAQGVEQGEKAKSVSTAKKLLALGNMSVEEIAEVCDLSVEEVIELKKQQDN